MTLRFTRRMPAPPALQLVERTPRFTVQGRRVFQEVVLRDGDGHLYRARIAA
jgi:hypothetical protein